MSKPHFVFTKYKNSFKIVIPNLEELTVSDIQILETFVSNRRGVFDFNTYSFVIPKKFEYHEFISLMNYLEIDGSFEEKELLENSTKKAIIGFGQYKGMLYSDLPDMYLLWLKSNYHGKDRELICDEITRRNT